MKAFERIELELPDRAEQRRIALGLDHALASARSAVILRGQVRELGKRVLHRYLHGLPRRRLGCGLSINLEEVAVRPGETYDICGVYGFGRGVFGRGAIDGSETSYAHLHRLREKTLVMSRLKAFEGALAVVPAEFTGCYVSPEYPTFEVNQSQLSPDYLRHLCAWEPFWRSLAQMSRGLGARRERVPASQLLEAEVPFPDLTEQHKIAEVLDRLALADKLASHQEAVLRALQPSLINAAFAGQF
jgi:type I restriction enzyme S subunit